MEKINVTPVSPRAQFKVGKKTYRFGDVFEANANDKRIISAIKCRVLKKFHKAKTAKPVVESKKEAKKETDKK